MLQAEHRVHRVGHAAEPFGAPASSTSACVNSIAPVSEGVFGNGSVA